MTKDLLPTVIQDIFQGLQDEDDDVRAVAASALVPIADDFVTILPQQVCRWNFNIGMIFIFVDFIYVLTSANYKLGKSPKGFMLRL